MLACLYTTYICTHECELVQPQMCIASMQTRQHEAQRWRWGLHSVGNIKKRPTQIKRIKFVKNMFEIIRVVQYNKANADRHKAAATTTTYA